MKRKNSTFVWIVVSIMIITILLILLMVPIFTVDLEISDCSNIDLLEINEKLEQFDLPAITLDELPPNQCVTNAAVLTIDLALYLTVKGLDIDDITVDDIPSGDRIKVSNLRLGNDFVTVSVNARKLFELNIDNEENVTSGIIKINKNLIGTIYRY